MIEGSLKSKTMWMQMATAVFGVALVTMPVLQDVMTPERYAYIFMGISVVNAMLRVVTTRPLIAK